MSNEHPLQQQITEASYGLMAAQYWVEGHPDGGPQTLCHTKLAPGASTGEREEIKVLNATSPVEAILEAWDFVKELKSKGGSGKTEPLKVKVYHYADDSLCTRISIGGSQMAGLYCTYRFGPQGGTIKDVCRMLEGVLLVLKQTPELPVDRIHER